MEIYKARIVPKEGNTFLDIIDIFSYSLFFIGCIVLVVEFPYGFILGLPLISFRGLMHVIVRIKRRHIEVSLYDDKIVIDYLAQFGLQKRQEITIPFADMQDCASIHGVGRAQRSYLDIILWNNRHIRIESRINAFKKIENYDTVFCEDNIAAAYDIYRSRKN